MKVLVFFSGGKDSQASLIWAVKEYGKKYVEAVFCDTGWENPITYDHVRTITEQMDVPLVILKSKKYNGFLDLIKKKMRFPSTKARFCTQELKSKPGVDYVLSFKENVIVVEGIRADESATRAKMLPQCTYFKFYFEPIGKNKKGEDVYHTYRKKAVIKWCKEYNADKIRPVFDWTAEQTINYIKDAGQTPNPLYYMGFSRVGCFPCVMWRKKEIKLMIENHPNRWEFLKQKEAELGRSFFPPKYIPKRFCKNRKFPMLADVEKYIKEKNATMDMLEEETPSCMSVYGLCE